MPTWKQYKHHHNKNTIVNKRNAPRNRIVSNRRTLLDKSHFAQGQPGMNSHWIKPVLQLSNEREEAVRLGERRHDPLRLRPHNNTLWLPPGQVAAFLALGSLLPDSRNCSVSHMCVRPIICFCTFLQLLMSFKGGRRSWMCLCPPQTPKHPSIHW